MMSNLLDKPEMRGLTDTDRKALKKQILLVSKVKVGVQAKDIVIEVPTGLVFVDAESIKGKKEKLRVQFLCDQIPCTIDFPVAAESAGMVYIIQS